MSEWEGVSPGTSPVRYRYCISIVDILTLLKNIDIDIDKDILENIDIDIDKDIL